MTAQTPGTQRAHETHDRLLVARFALGDALAPDEAGAVRALLASCTDCNALVGELQVVQRATAESLAPVRPRDFFITAEQAETLRPNAWNRFLGRLSAPRMTVLRPLAGATLAMGIVLVGASAVLPRDDARMSDREPAPVGTFAADNAAGAMMVSGSPEARVVSDPLAKASPAPFSGMETAPQTADGSPDPRLDLRLPGSPDPGATITAYFVPGSFTPDAPVDGQQDVLTASAMEQATEPSGDAMLILGVVLALVSALVLVLVWLARRTVDPLLR